MSEYDDPYDRSGQFLDLMIAGWWEHHGATVADALRALPTDAGPVVDAGAGGGLGTRLIARTLPGTPVLAVEPSLPLSDAADGRIFRCDPIGPAAESQLIVGVLMAARVEGGDENLPFRTFVDFHIATPPK